MKTSPLRLENLYFAHVQVDSLNRKVSDLGREKTAIDFDGVVFKTHILAKRAKEQEKDPRNYYVTLRVVIDNKEGKHVPYLIDVTVWGFFLIAEQIPLERRDDVVLVNGASLLYGAIREMVTNITNRSVGGGLMLPTVSFHDHASDGKKAVARANVAARPKRKVRTG